MDQLQTDNIVNNAMAQAMQNSKSYLSDDPASTGISYYQPVTAYQPAPAPTGYSNNGGDTYVQQQNTTEPSNENYFIPSTNNGYTSGNGEAYTGFETTGGAYTGDGKTEEGNTQIEGDEDTGCCGCVVM